MPITVVALTPGRRVASVHSSLALRLPGAADGEPGNALTLCAAAAGAFTSMAPDLIALLDLDPRRAIIDGQLDLPPDADEDSQLATQLEEVSTIDHALGVLLDRGLLPTQGRLELERVAVEQRSTVHAVALQVLDTARRDPDPK